MINNNPLINQSRRIADWSSIEIPANLINKFLELWTITFVRKPKPLPEDPIGKLREMLKDAVLINDDIYRYRRWLFIIENNAFHDIILIPWITEHAKMRLKKRLNYSEPDMYFLVATEIWAGQPLSKEKIKQYWKTADEDNIRAVRFEKHIYFLNESFDIITVIAQGQ